MSVIRLALRDARYLRFENLVFDYIVPDDDEKIRPFEIRGSRDIAISGSLFSGDVAKGHALGHL